MLVSALVMLTEIDCVYVLGDPEPERQFIFQLLDVLPAASWSRQ